MAVIASDNFTRANSTTTLGTTPVGAKVWQKYGTQQWGIQSNMAYPITYKYDSPTYIDTGVADQFFVQFKIGAYHSSSQFHYRNVSDGNGYVIETPGVYRMTGFAFVEKGRFTMALNDVIRVEIRGNQHTIFRNGTQVLQFTDAAHNTGTKTGFSTNSSTTRFDDILVETFTTADTTPPAEVPTLTETHTQNSAMLTWTKPADADFASVRITRNGIQVSTNNTGTTFSDSGLSPATSYTYVVRTVDTTGNVSTGKTIVVTTSAAPDTTPPAEVPTLTATKTDTSIDLTWTKPADADFNHVRIWRDGVQIASNLAGTTYTDSGRTPSTAYTYILRTVDGTGNVSAGKSITVTTDAPPASPLPIADNFNRANNASTLGTTPIGGKTWQSYGTQQWGVLDNEAYPITSSYDNPVYIDAGVSDQLAFEVRMSVQISTSQIMWRIQDANLNYFFIEDTRIFKYNAGVFTTLVSGLVFNSGDLIRVELRGAEHTVFQNGVQIAQFTDTDFLNATKFGFGTNNNDSRFDDFALMQFGSGDLTPPSVNIISVSRSKISAQSGVNSSVIKFTFSEDVTEWRIRRDGVSYETGVLIASGGAVTAGVEAQATILNTHLNIEGQNRINIYSKDASGNWTTYNS